MEFNSTEDNESCRTHVPIILMTPPPVDIDAWFRSRGYEEDAAYDRANDVARNYGNRVKQVGVDFNCSILDVFDLLGGNGDDYGQNLRDGLHLSGDGNKLLYTGLMDLITTDFPELAPMLDGNGRYGKVGVPLEEKLWSELC